MGLVLPLLCLVLVGCKAPRAVEVSGWGQAIAGARDQSDVAFTAVNTLIRERQLEFAVTQPTLNESLFQPGLDGESIRAWNAALDTMSAYARSVAQLADPSTFAGTGASAATLGQAIAARAQVDVFTQHPGLASAVTKIGDAITRSAAGGSARRIMQGANPGVQDLLHEMYLMLGEIDDVGLETGVIPTVTTNWNVRLAAVQSSFLAPGSNKSAVARSFVQLLEQRDASINALRSLQSTLLRLADNHAQLAAGGSADSSTVLAQIKDSTELIRSILVDLKKTPTP